MKNSQILKNTCLLFLIAVASTAIGCRSSNPHPQAPEPRRINSIRIGNFQCEDAITAEAVRNVFIEVLTRYRNVKLVREGEADVIIEGTVTISQGGSSSSKIGAGPGWVAGKGKGVAGDYVSGVTSLMLRDGAIVTSTSWGQVMAEGGELLPPESVARNAAERLLGALYREGLKKP